MCSVGDRTVAKCHRKIEMSPEEALFWAALTAPSPTTVDLGRCCARCRRGMPNHGVLPCGLGGVCACHT